MTDSVPTYFRYWGKAERDGSGYHLLPYHCLDVAAVGKVLLDKNPQLLAKFSNIMGLEENACKYWLLLFLALHDMGKFSITFQGQREDLLECLQQVKNTKHYTVRHDSLGFLLWKFELWRKCILSDMENTIDYWQDTFDNLSPSFCGHHGTPPKLKGPNDFPLKVPTYYDPQDKLAAGKFIEDLCAVFAQSVKPSISTDLAIDVNGKSKTFSWILAGFAVLCDWIGSNASWFRYKSDTLALEKYWQQHAVPQAMDAVSMAGIGTTWRVDANVSFNSVFHEINNLSPLQCHVAGCPLPNSPQIAIIEDITGSGKTEAALFLARRMMAQGLGSGIFFALPTMATSNAMFNRLAEKPSPKATPVYPRLFAKGASPSIVLAHGARHLSDLFMNAIMKQGTQRNRRKNEEESATAQCTEWLADNRKKALLADIGVGTLDQALLAVLPSRFQSLRLFGLSGHILIVDEVHAYDPYMNKLLQTLLTFHAALGGSAILLSATLPRHTRQDMLDSFAKGLGRKTQMAERDNYPLATHMSLKEKEFYEIPVEAMQERKTSVAVELVSDFEEIKLKIVDASQAGKCTCWIRNTVHDALAGYEALKEVVPPDKLLLFHARFAMGDRLGIENRVIGTFGKNSGETERRGMVLVATQVVEQSLDLDFDLLCSDLAPMDLMIQRAGRLHRHRRDKHGNILALDNGTDQRDPPIFLVHSPIPLEDADENWFKQAFPKAAYVYPSHGCLWLTAWLLKDRGALRMPDDARELIEAAFTDSGELKIPPPLFKRDREVDGKIMCDKSAAHIIALKLDEGYATTPNQWWEDMRTPTRLGDAETTVRLARWVGKNLSPWYEDNRYPWDMSQVSISSKKIFTESQSHEPALKQELEALKQSLPDKGKWSVMVPLCLDGHGCWRGEALDKDGGQIEVTYSHKLGMAVSKKEK